MNSSQQLLANRYQLLRQLAAGSYAETWLALDLVLDRHVAIKLLHSSGKEVEQSEHEQFLREARIAAAVSHQNVVAVFDGGAKGSRPFLIMEWVDGHSLKQEILGQRIGLVRALDVTSELLAGLASIHEQGIIHRDVKPQNIMVNESGTVKLTDFGIARLVGELDTRSDGTTAGSAAYMAPEQARGLTVGPAADVYAAGIVLYEMLTGRLPFVHEDPQQVMLQHIAEPVVPPRMLNPAIPGEVEAIILKALQKDAAHRYQSADEMRDEIVEAQYQVLAWRPTQPAYQFDAPSRMAIPRMAWIAASIAMMFVLVAGATTLAVRGSETPGTQTLSEVAETIETPEPTTEPDPTREPGPEPTVTPEAENTETERPPVESNDEFRVRGEVVVEGPPEPVGGVNRPAPSRARSDAELDTFEPDDSGQEVVANDQQQWTPPPPTPTPEPLPDEAEEDVSDDKNSGQEEQPSEGSEEPGDNGSDENAETDSSGSDENAEAPGDESAELDDPKTDGQGETGSQQDQTPQATPDLDNGGDDTNNGNGSEHGQEDVADENLQNDAEEQASNQEQNDPEDRSGEGHSGSGDAGNDDQNEGQPSASDQEDQQTSTQQVGEAEIADDVDETEQSNTEKQAEPRQDKKNKARPDLDNEGNDPEDEADEDKDDEDDDPEDDEDEDSAEFTTARSGDFQSMS
ncbi:MAG: protein kinase [Thermomicrobiaceae bacterium]